MCGLKMKSRFVQPPLVTIMRLETIQRDRSSTAIVLTVGRDPAEFGSGI